MRALILTAGLGTRLRPLTLTRAKAAVPVNGEAIVRRVISWGVAQGITDIVLNLHHRPATIAAAVGDGADLGARVRYSWEDPVLGSAGGPRHALPLLADNVPEDEPFLLINGDTLTDLPLAEMGAGHRASGALVTLALTRNPRPDLYGGVLVQDRRVTGFTRRGAAAESYHFIGVQVVSRAAFLRLADGVPAESVMQLYPELMREDAGAVAAYLVDAPFRDVGTPAEYLETSLELAEREGNRMVHADTAAVDPSARLNRTAVWDNVRIEADVELDECIVCDNVVLPRASRYTRSALVQYGGEPLREGERLDGALIVRSF